MSLACLAMLALLGMASTLRAETAGDALRSYLTARLEGELEAARSLWERTEMRRARAMGMSYQGIEASYDSYWFRSAAERQRFAQEHRLVLRDSSVAADVAHFSVEVLAGGKTVDRWRYLVQKSQDGWKVSLPLQHDSRSWKEEESRYVKVRSSRLTRINRDAMHAMDHHVDSLFVWFATPKAAQLRLERIKAEIYIVDGAEQVQKLLGDASRIGYLPGSERIVTEQVAALAELTSLVANLTLRQTAAAGAPFVVDGLARAMGGEGEVAAEVYLQRLRGAVLRDELDLDIAFSADVSAGADGARALWNHALLHLLGPERYFALYGELRGTPESMRRMELAAVRRAIETAAGRKGNDLVSAVRAHVRTLENSIQSGCERWPEDIPDLESVLTWRDQETTWSMRGYDMGDEYAFTMGAHREGMPEWRYDYIDSLAQAHGRSDFKTERKPEPGRPSGDPPYVLVTMTPRYQDEIAPYGSRIYETLFPGREYYNELMGFFATYDLVRVYDYRIDRLVAEYRVDQAPPGDPVFYDEEAGRVCFRVKKSVFGKPLMDFAARGGRYTGE